MRILKVTAGALLLGGILLAGPVPAAAQCDPAACGGGAAPSADGGAINPFGDNPYDIGGVLRSGVVNGVVNGAQWLGDYYGRNYPAVPAGQTPPADPPAAAPPPTPASAGDSGDPPFAIDGGRIAGPVGDYVTRGAWQIGTWAGSTPPPQLGSGPNGDDGTPPPSAAPAPSQTGIWTQPLVKSAPDGTGRFK